MKNDPAGGVERMDQRTLAGESGAVPHRGGETELLDLRAIWLALRRNWLLIALVTAAVLLATAIAFASTDPTYVATSKVMVERVPGDLIAPANDNQPVIPADSPTVDTAVAVMRSPALVGRAVDQLRLTRHPLFNPDVGGGNDTAASGSSAARDRAIRILAGGLDVERDGVSYAINIHYASPDPVLAAVVANGVMAAYLERQRDARTEESERVARRLGGRLDELRSEVLDAESAVAAYRARHELFAASEASSITQQQLSVLDSELASSRAAQAAAEARQATVRGRGGGSAEAIQESLASGVVVGLRQQRAQLAAVAADLGARYGPRHPARVQAEEQLAAVDRQIAAEIGRVASSVSAEANVARQRTASIAGSIGTLQARLATDNAASVRLNELERNAESARAIYQAFLDNYRQALARQGTESSGASAISEAQVPVVPSDPNPLVYLLIGLLAAGALSGAAVLIAESRRRVAG